MKYILQKIIYFLLNLLPRRLNGVSVLMYHSVGRNGAEFTVTPENFEKQMRYISEKGVSTFFASDVVEAVREGTPITGVCITFDDGYEDNFKVALPVLQKYGLKASFFISTGFLDKEMETSRGVAIRMISQNRLHELHNNPSVEILPHSVNHRRHTDLSDEDIRSEIGGSKKYIEEISEKNVSVYAYPKGAYDDRVSRIAEMCGIKGAFSVWPGIVLESSERFSLPRNTIDSTTTVSEFKVKVSQRVLLYEKIKGVFRR